MKNKLKMRMVLLSIGLSGIAQFHPVFSQSLDRYVIPAAGASLTTQEGSIHFSIGEPIAQTITNEISLSQGFHQEWAVVTALDPHTKNKLAVNVYPNPTIDMLNIESVVTAKFSIFDVSGKIILADIISSGLNTIVLPNIPAGMYVLVYTTDTGEKQTFKLEFL